MYANHSLVADGLEVKTSASTSSLKLTQLHIKNYNIGKLLGRSQKYGSETRLASCRKGLLIGRDVVIKIVRVQIDISSSTLIYFYHIRFLKSPSPRALKMKMHTVNPCGYVVVCTIPP